jgi:FMN phosphatase YigB (HAD superfamily)
MKNNNLIKYLDSKSIEAVVFDIDNTLLQTFAYYDYHTKALSKKLHPVVASEIGINEFVEIIDQILSDSYTSRKWAQPILVDFWYIDALSEYLEGAITQELKDEVEEYFKDFYNVVPVPYDTTPNVLKTVIDSNRKIALHSHAQEDWTRMKAEYLSEIVDYDIPYLATPIDVHKDKESWLKAFNLIDSKAKDTLVIGDSFVSDILPSIEAGSRCLTWMDRYSRGLPTDYKSKEDIELKVVNKLEDIL